MPARRFAAALAATCALLVGCGGSNPGSGTATLYVEVIAESDGSTDGTLMRALVREGSSGGNLVTDAVVIVRGAKGGETALPWQGVRFGNWAAGAYFKEIPWDTHWSLEIRRGPDALDAALEAPGLTTLLEPIAGTTYRRAEQRPLVLRWKDGWDRRAKLVEIKVGEAKYQRTLNEDPLFHEILPNQLVQKDKEELMVTRTNEIHLAGGTAGSYFRATTRHKIQVNVE